MWNRSSNNYRVLLLLFARSLMTHLDHTLYGISLSWRKCFMCDNFTTSKDWICKAFRVLCRSARFFRLPNFSEQRWREENWMKRDREVTLSNENAHRQKGTLRYFKTNSLNSFPKLLTMSCLTQPQQTISYLISRRNLKWLTPELTNVEAMMYPTSQQERWIQRILSVRSRKNPTYLFERWNQQSFYMAHTNLTLTSLYGKDGNKKGECVQRN